MYYNTNHGYTPKITEVYRANGSWFRTTSQTEIKTYTNKDYQKHNTVINFFCLSLFDRPKLTIDYQHCNEHSRQPAKEPHSKAKTKTTYLTNAIYRSYWHTVFHPFFHTFHCYLSKISRLDPLGFVQAPALLVGQNGATFRQALEALVIASAPAEDLPSFSPSWNGGYVVKYIILISKAYNLIVVW